MRYFLLLCLMACQTEAEVRRADLTFDLPYYEAVDQLALLQTQTEGTYLVGYVYIDETAGFTLELMGKLAESEQGLRDVDPPVEEKMSLKMRIPKQEIMVAVLNDEQKSQLGIGDKPEWLLWDQARTEQVSYLKNIGFHYNAVGASHLALPLLRKAYDQDAQFDGLLFELAYSLNATGAHGEAADLIESHSKKVLKDDYVIKEYGFALTHADRLDDADKIYRKALRQFDSDTLKAEAAFNMVQAYFHQGDQKKFKYWLKRFKKHAEAGTQMYDVVQYFESQLITE